MNLYVQDELHFDTWTVQCMNLCCWKLPSVGTSCCICRSLGMVCCKCSGAPRHSKHHSSLRCSYSYADWLAQDMDVGNRHGTHPRPQKSCGNVFDAPSLHTVLIQSDLGFQLTYCGPPRLGKQKSRFQAAKNRLKKLASIRADIKDKASLALNGAYAVALYRSEFLPI